MDPARFFAASRLVIVAGKGGVGKTVVSAALAGPPRSPGLSTLIIEVEGTHGLALDVRSGGGEEARLGYEEVTLAQAAGPGVRATCGRGR